MGLNWSKESCYITTRQRKKYTVILDLDNTLIGDIGPLSRQNHILKKYFNQVVTEDAIAIKRPGTGIPPQAANKLVGRIALKDVEADEVLQWDMFSGDEKRAEPS